MEENITLEEMRAQISLLKEKLDKESIVNDKLMRDAIRQKMGTIGLNAIIEYIAGLFVITCGNLVFYQLTHSWPFVIVTALYMIICMVATYYTHSKANKKDCSGDLLTVAKKMKEIKNIYHQWLYFAIPSLVLWVLWLCWLIVQENEFAKEIITSMLVGLVIGAIIGLFSRHKVLNACDEVISQIES